MNYEVVITCAVTGSGDTTSRSEKVPVTPKQIAESALDAARAGAAVVHLHVRDPETGKPSRDPELFKQTVDIIRSSDTDVVINLTAGMGGDLTLGPPDDPMAINTNATDMAPWHERVGYVDDLRPEICTLDCGTMNFGHGDYIMTNTPTMLAKLAEAIASYGVKPEIEVFDAGHVMMANNLIDSGLIESPPLFQLCMGIPYGAQATTGMVKAMRDELPAGANWSAFSISRMQMPMVAQAVLLGGNVRVGLEDNIWLDKGVLATNAQLVERARQIIELMGARVLTPAEAREKFSLTKQV